MKVSDIEVIDADFDEAAVFYCHRSFGDTKQVCKDELVRRYKEEEDLDCLVLILARHRMKYTTSVPKEPTNVMTDGLPRQIVSWLKMDGRKTPARLFAELEITGHEIPQWLRDESELQDKNHVPSKSACAAIIYKAMIARHSTEILIPD